jgi:hypothetical protein
MYLLQLDSGRTLDTDAAHISQAEATGSRQGQPTGALRVEHAAWASHLNGA